jgi:site-specific recombinase XerD
LNDYEINERKSDVSLKLRLREHIIPFFGSMPENDVGTTDIDRYVKTRREAGAENGTINRELAALKRMCRLAYDSKPRRVRDLLRFPA